MLTVLRRLVGGGLRGQLIELARRHSRVDPADDLLRDEGGLHVLGVEAVAQVADPGRDLVERHRLLAAVALNHEHPAALLTAKGLTTGTRVCAAPGLASSLPVLLLTAGRGRQDAAEKGMYSCKRMSWSLDLACRDGAIYICRVAADPGKRLCVGVYARTTADHPQYS